ncbi:hypothetical protein RJ639_016112 [Escallonia herrerae]|uniref:RNase H type-1 domain-containing protein n=1 Tax=Escallonia herrerae TaxID=1293975 RepID=A0AA88VE02_9ASTE|nr:hypothetical protein RJ639_016112 [Escallonia herrerae]
MSQGVIHVIIETHHSKLARTPPLSRAITLNDNAVQKQSIFKYDLTDIPHLRIIPKEGPFGRQSLNLVPKECLPRGGFLISFIQESLGNMNALLDKANKYIQVENTWKLIKDDKKGMAMSDAPRRHELLSFIDVYSGYNQIMHSSLSMDSTVIRAEFHVKDLKKTFDKIKLNPLKCTFGVVRGNFLASMVSQCGIEANPEKIKIKIFGFYTLMALQHLAAAAQGSSSSVRRNLSSSMIFALVFQASINEAEYEALLEGIRLANALKVDSLSVYNDSQLVVNHVLGEYEARDETKVQYLHLVKALAARFKNLTICHVPRDQNAQADSLSRLASMDVFEFPHNLH